MEVLICLVLTVWIIAFDLLYRRRSRCSCESDCAPRWKDQIDVNTDLELRVQDLERHTHSSSDLNP